MSEVETLSALAKLLEQAIVLAEMAGSEIAYRHLVNAQGGVWRHLVEAQKAEHMEDANDDV